MRIEVIEGGRADGTDLVSAVEKSRLLVDVRRGRPKNQYYDSEEYRAGGQPGLRLRASAEGVLIHGMPQRKLGVRQIRALARELSRAADEAEKRGAPEMLMESSCG